LDAQRASFVQYFGEANRSIEVITAAHTKSMTDMQSKLQSSFDRMQYLEKTFKDVPQHVTDHLDTTVPQVIASAVDRTLPTTLATILHESLPPTIKKVMDGTILDSFTSLLEGSFTDFMEKCSSVSTDVARVMRDVVASAEAPLLERYSAVQEDYTTCTARLDKVLTLLSATGGTSPSAPASSSTPSMHDTTVGGGGQERHPSFPQGRVEDFDFSYHGDARSAGGTRRGVPAGIPPLNSHVRSPPSAIDTSDDGVLGGRITTPRFTDRSRVARAKQMSKFDSAGLAEAKYHIGDMGVEMLTPQIISKCGYQSFHRDHPEDILLCYSEIGHIHRVVLQDRTNPRTHFSGPAVEYILEKALPVFPRLRSLDVADVVHFYDGMQKISMRYLLPLMPFDSICLAFGFEGLCPPGLGTIRYAAIASAWMDVLPRILPKENSDIESVTFSVGYESNNRFDLLWRVLELAVPGFKSTNPVQVPSWTRDSDILSFCREHLLYFRLQSKHNMFFSSRTQTNIFLRNIQLSEYADVVTTLQSHVNAYICEEDEGYLPTNLCINGIATSIHTNAATRVQGIAHGLPRVRRAFGDTSLSDSWASSDAFDSVDLTLCAVQGYSPHVYRVEHGRDQDRLPPRGRPYDRGSSAGRNGRDHGRLPPRDWDGPITGRDGGLPSPSPRDCSIRPDRNRRGFLPHVQCDACKRVGHVATNCDMLAMALFLDKYVQQSLSVEDKKTVESTWLRKHKDRLGLPQHPPSQVIKAYCADLDISTDILNCAMDWDCWPLDEGGDFLMATQVGGSGLSD